MSNSITTTRVFQRVPVRIVDLPSTKTVRGLMPDGYLDRRLTITITGSKAALDRIGPDDLEVIADASNKKGDWIIQVSKKNLVCLNPDIDLQSAISHVNHSELLVRMCRFVTEKVPVFISPPIGSAPSGYHFLDVWPQKLFHIISGPEDDVRLLQEQGVSLEFDLSSITKEDLDSLRDNNPQKDEVSYPIPDLWKMVRVPYLNNIIQPLHCPDSCEVQLNFLFEEFLPIKTSIPIRLFRPEGAPQDISFKIRAEGVVQEQKGEHFLKGSLFATNVSRLFLDTVKDYLQIVILPTNKNGTVFCWEPQFIAEGYLEDAYVKKAIAEESFLPPHEKVTRSLRASEEEYHRLRFRDYMQRFQLYRSQNTPLSLVICGGPEGLTIREENSGGN